MNKEIFDKYKQQEAQKIRALISKMGVDVEISPILDNKQELNDYDPFFSNEDIEIINSKNRIKEKEVFGEKIYSRMYIVTEYDPTPFSVNTNEDNNINNIVEAFILNNDLKIGSIVKTLYNIQYKIISIEKNRGIEDILKYKMIKV